MIRLLNALLIFQTNVSQLLLHFSEKKSNIILILNPKASSIELNRAKIHIVQCSFSLILL